MFCASADVEQIKNDNENQNFYILKDKLYVGAESIIFNAEIFGIPCIAKMRRKKKFINDILWANISKQRTKKEVSAMHKLKEFQIQTPNIIYFDFDRSTIFMEKIIGNTLDVFDKQNGPAKKKYYEKAADMLALFHKNNIWHGDFNPRNIIVQTNNRKLIVIDFGLIKMNARNEEMAYDILTMVKGIFNTSNVDAFLNRYKKACPHVYKAYIKIASLGRYK